MKKSNKPVRGIRWDLIFERRQDLEPPGFKETIAQLYPKEKTNEKPEA